MSDNGAYMKKVLLQVEDLNAVIEKIKSEDFVAKDNIYLLGSSMGGVTVATCAVTHTDRRYKGYNVAVSGYIL